mgnify:CR=1 FL=1
MNTSIASQRVLNRATELAAKVRPTNRPTVYYAPASDGTEHRVLVDFQDCCTGPVLHVHCSCTWGRTRRLDGPYCTHAVAVLMTIQAARENAS